MVFVVFLYTTYSWVRHDHYLTTGFDLGIFDQAVRAYAHFRPPIVPLKAPLTASVPKRSDTSPQDQ